MEHTARSTIRKAKDLAKGYSNAESLVREATSNDPWGAPAAVLDEIAQYSYVPSQAKQIMEMVYKRMNDSGKNWRHVVKSLTLLDYLIKNGSERCLEYTAERLYDIKTLKEFVFIDEDGKDQGLNIRLKSKEIAALIQDPDRIKEEREKSKNLKEKLGKSPTSFSGNQGNSDFAVSSLPAFNSDSTTKRSSFYGTPTNNAFDNHIGFRNQSSSFSSSSGPRMIVTVPRKDDDVDMQKAIEESKRSYQMEVLQRQRSSEAIKQAKINIPRYQGSNDPFSSSQPFQPSPVRPNSTVFDDSFGKKSSDPFSSDSRDRSVSFNAAFDGGNEARGFPHQFASQDDPNARMATIARNAPEIDPFAEMATTRARSTSLNQRPQSTYASHSSFNIGFSSNGLPPPPAVASNLNLPSPVVTAPLPPPLTSAASVPSFSSNPYLGDILAPLPSNQSQKSNTNITGVVNINLDDIKARQLYGMPAKKHNWGTDESEPKSLNDLSKAGQNPFKVF